MTQQNEDNFENLEIPEIELNRFREKLRLTVLNTRRSSRLGVLLLIVPFYFVMSAILKAYFGIALFFEPFEYMLQPERREVFNLVSPVILIGSVFFAALLNFLAIVHISFENRTHEFLVGFSVKKRPFNLIVVTISSILLFIMLLYAVVENL